MKSARRLIAPALLAVSFTVARASSAADTATAQALFDDARALMDAGKFADACPKLEESERLDPGTGTLFQLAACYEGAGRTASAWAKYLEVDGTARAAGQTERADYARGKATALQSKLSRLLIEVPQASRLAGLSVRRGATEVGQPVWGSAVPVDPGSIEISASAPGHKSWQTTITVTSGPGESRVVVPVLQAEAAPVAPVAPPVAAPPPSTAAPAPLLPPRSSGDEGSGTSPLAWVGFGLGGLGLIVGTVAGIFVLDKKSALESGCPNGQCPPDLHDDHSSFNTMRTISTIGFGVGVAGIALGTIVLLTSGGNSRREGVQAQVGPGWLGVRSTF